MRLTERPSEFADWPKRSPYARGLMRFKITANDIADGKAGDAVGIVKKVIKRIIGPGHEVSLCGYFVFVLPWGHTTVDSLPHSIRLWMIHYNAGHRVGPVGFYLEL